MVGKWADGAKFDLGRQTAAVDQCEEMISPKKVLENDLSIQVPQS